MPDGAVAGRIGYVAGSGTFTNDTPPPPPAMPVARGYKVATYDASTQAPTLDWTSPTAGSAPVNGDWVRAVVSYVTPSVANYIDAPVGWETLVDLQLIGTMWFAIYRGKFMDGDVAPTFQFQNSRLATVSLDWGSGDYSAPWTIGAGTTRAAAGGTTAIWAETITVPDDLTLALGYGVERTTASETGISGVTNGTAWMFAPAGASATCTICACTHEQLVAGATGRMVITYPNTQALNGWGVQFGVPADHLSGPFTTADVLADPLIAIAHRGGTSHWPEMTEFAYDQSVVFGMKALELSVVQCATGEWVLHHDVTTGRMCGTDLDIATSDWADLSALMVTADFTDNPAQADRPLGLLDTILDKYGDSHVMLIQPKVFGQGTALLDYLDAHPYASTDRVVIKLFKGQHATGTAALLRGYLTWGAYFAADGETGGTDRSSSFSWLGVEWDATEAQWATMLAFGKPVIAHVCYSANAALTGKLRGADGLMLANLRATCRPDGICPAMTVDAHVLARGNDAGIASDTWGTTSVSPAVDALQLMVLSYSRDGSSPSAPTSVVGNGLTYALAATVHWDTSGTPRHSTFIYRAMGAATSGGVTITHSFTDTNARMAWSHVQVTGVVTGSNGANAIVQIANSSVNSTSNSQTATLAAFADVDNATLGIGAWGSGSGSFTTANGSGFRHLGDSQSPATGTQVSHGVEFKRATDTTVDFTLVGTNGAVAIGVELAAA